MTTTYKILVKSDETLVYGQESKQCEIPTLSSLSAALLPMLLFYISKNLDSPAGFKPAIKTHFHSLYF